MSAQRGRYTPLTLELLHEWLAYDPSTGVFTWRKQRGAMLAGSVAGSPSGNGYLQVNICGRMYRSHRLAWLYVHGAWPQFEIDHINGIPTDNRIANLRDVTRQRNAYNLQGPRRDNVARVLGVGFDERVGKYRARIKVNGRERWLGYFDTAAAAGAAYMAAKNEILGEAA